ncbi:MAG: sulfotransferase [Deltaproteobacteria bacterium]|nr:sulfotransferase [Deltaproteobacteria bacterium]MBW2697870.1 sulfotransferase [Deltaproteobacteria bacterium]
MQSPQLPLIPRALNFAGRQLERVGLQPIRLDRDAILAGARRATELDDFGDDSFREGLDRLLLSLDEDAQLSVLGRYIARTDIGHCLENRLQLVDWHKRHPEIGRGEIRRPIFICGQGRTGTTILHELLALDPANRVPLSWEVEFPFPPPERDTYTTDPRIEACQKELDGSERLVPDFKRMHRMGARLPQECVRITASDFRSLIFTAQWRVIGYTQWLTHEADMSSAYAFHKQMLQLLQWRCPAERWIVKSPGHLWCLEDVLGTYPDALFIQTHRDPLHVLSSLSSLEVVLRKMSSDRILLSEIAQEWSRWCSDSYDRSVDFRQKGMIDSSRIVDLQFRDFISDPIRNVQSIYDQFGLELRPDVEKNMRDYVASNPSDRDGKHVHRIEDTGLDFAEERAKVKRYQEYFDVPSET